ncbi:DUF3617 family protein [Pseudoduganella sp. DS3]|uniref:DUF3617 family protein n=1 Tax=Pseudoduganella guangdongensis TaxID=2692179 RepID=A0A6N9HQA7_9BURK|nr:DUF3617 domain-containing protein [Pseudoduganella guangdongensis]MYN05649.1 DUF3617 family protein [Pseudoduganella guangdongensis]
MNIAVKAFAIAASLAAIPFTSQAEVIPLKLTPGLWEETRVTMINGQNATETLRAARERMMARMTPEQRKIMEEKMGGRGGAGPVQVCLTPAQVAKGIDTNEVKRKMEDAARGCKLDILSASSAGAKFKAVCQGPNGTGYQGSGEYTVSSPKEWRFKMVSDGKMTGPDANLTGGEFHASQEVTARWKGSDCGAVPPREEG